MGTFGELHTAYVEGHAKRFNKKSWRQPFRLIERHVLPRLGKLDVKSITQADICATLGKVTSDSVFKQTLASASTVFTWAIKTKVLQHNPCSGIETKETKARKRRLKNSELALVWPKLTPALRTILLTAQRPNEVRCMRREHIVDEVWWQMPGPEIPELGWPGTKNGEDNLVFLSEPVRELVGEGTSGFVFKRGERLDAVMRKICAELGVTDRVRPHDLRRSWTYFAAKLGVDDPTIDRILNHVVKTTTKVHYNHHKYESQNAAAMTKVAEYVLAVVEGRGTDTDNVVPLRRDSQP